MRRSAGDDNDDADDHAAYAALDTLIARAEAQPDPVRWTRGQVREALERLERLDRPQAVKAEAKRQLFAIERRVLAALLKTSSSRGAVLVCAYVVALGLPLF